MAFVVSPPHYFVQGEKAILVRMTGQVGKNTLVTQRKWVQPRGGTGGQGKCFDGRRGVVEVDWEEGEYHEG